jgi:Tfp pilus assembly protein PilW
MMVPQNLSLQKTSPGFTLVELMVVAALVFVLFIGLASVYMLIDDSWDRGVSLVNLQRDGSYAMLELTTAIRKGTAVAISPSTQVTIKDAGNSVIERFYLDSSDNTLRDDSGTKVIPSMVDSLLFTQSGPTIHVEMVLADDRDNKAYFSTGASLRN